MLPRPKNDVRFSSNTDSRLIGRASRLASARPSLSSSAAQAENGSKNRIQVLKFGGTSMNGATCIQRVAAIVQNKAREARIAVVVSAMSGVTDQLLRLASAAQAQDRRLITKMLNDLRFRHVDALTELVRAPEVRIAAVRKLYDVLAACAQVCREVMLAGRLDPAERDLISGIGERLSAPLLAAALAERGVAAEFIEATKLIVTDANFGEAEPLMNETRAQCTARLLPLLQNGIVPVITGFIGATRDGVPTTLGRNGSDYSATIVAAGIDADEVVIWTDVDGFMTADPNVVSRARVIPELSYDDASELASFGAKVLHPKTLRAIRQTGLPVWIRKTFAPEAPGTKITPEGPYVKNGVGALATAKQVALVTIEGEGIAMNGDLISRAVEEITRLHPDSVLTTGSISQNEIGIVVSALCADEMVTRLVSYFGPELQNSTLRKISHRLEVGLVTAVGSRLNAVADQAKHALRTIGADVILESCSETGSRVSFLVPAESLTQSIVALHRALVTNEDHRVRHGEQTGTIPCTGLEAYGAS